MKKLEMKVQLQNYIDCQNQIQIKRKRIDNNSLECIPLMLGEKLLLVQYLYDYDIDGYMIIRLKDITNIRNGESEKFYEYILKQEQIINQVKKPDLTNVDNWEGLLSELKMFEKNIIIECEDISGNDFYIGKIIEINKNRVSFLHFNPVGEWEKVPKEIIFKDLTAIRFETRYINIISKYLKK